MAGFKKIAVRYTYDESDTALIETMLSGVFRRDVLGDARLERERVDNSSKFSAQFAENIFQDEYAVLYELAATRRLTTGRWDMMEAVIEENHELILSAPQINLSQFSSEYTASDTYDAFVSLTKAAYERICDMPFAGAEGFRSACNSFIEVFERKYTRQCLNVMGAILNSPDPFVDFRGGRRREYQGYKGANEFFAVERMRIDALRGAQRARQFVLDTEWLHSQIDPDLRAEREKRTELLCKLNIPEIDSFWSGLRRTHVIGIIGPPKGGKTTLSAFCVHRLLQEGRKVAVWAMEGSAQESWIDKLIAARCSDKGLNITTKDLADGLMGFSAEDRRRVDEVRAELTQDERLSFIEKTGYVEDFLEVIDGHYRAFNRFDALVVDSLLNLQTRTGRKKSEYLSSAYILLKDYVEHKLETPPVCIVTAQFKQEAIKEARNSAEITFDETSGGETAETIRTPDEVLGIFGTPAQKEVNRVTVYHIASRHSAQFKNTELRALFGCAQFSSVNSTA